MATQALSLPLLLGVVVVIVVVAAAAILLHSHPASPGGTTTSSSGSGTGSGSSPGSTTAQSTTATPSGPGGGSPGVTQVTGGPGQVVLSNSEYASLMGPGGKYNASGFTNSSYWEALVAQYGHNSSVFTNNVTGVWVAGYSINRTSGSGSSSGSKVGFELVFQAKNPQALYKYFQENSSSGGYNVTNASINGFTYSYVGSQAYFNVTGLVGWKDQYLVYFYAMGSYVPSGSLSTTIAADLP